jgi:hypothetical protein
MVTHGSRSITIRHGTPDVERGCRDVRLSTWFKLAVLVIVAVIVVQISKSIASHTESGCGLASSGNAHAETIDCPSYVTQAASDASWAAQQQQEMTATLTIGHYITNRSPPRCGSRAVGTNRTVSRIESSIFFEVRRASQTLAKANRTLPATWRLKVAMVMREAGATSGVVAINHPQMCSGPVSCRVAVTTILPKGSVLYVWELGAGESIECDGEGTCH